MSKKVKKFCCAFAVFCALGIIAIAGGLFNRVKFYVPIGIMSVAVLVCAICIFSIFKNKNSIFKFSIVGLFLGMIGVGIYLAMNLTGVLELLKDTENLQEIIQKTGVWAPIVYIIIQFAQVTLVPIPSTVTIIAGLQVFTLVEVVIYSTIGLILGSVFAFALGKIFGVKLVVWIVGAKAFNKYQKLLRGRDKTMLFLMFLLPVFPDDLLCLLAGVTTMNYTTFFIMQIISRPIGVIMSAMGGELLKTIPFYGWYLALWAFIILLIVAMFVLVWKYSGKLEALLVRAITSKIAVKTDGITLDRDYLQEYANNLVIEAKVTSDNDYIDKHKTSDTKNYKYKINYKN